MIENESILGQLAKDAEMKKLDKMINNKPYNPYNVDLTKQIKNKQKKPRQNQNQCSQISSVIDRPQFNLRTGSKPMNNYNALKDRYCTNYLKNKTVKNHLINVGLINQQNILIEQQQHYDRDQKLLLSELQYAELKKYQHQHQFDNNNTNQALINNGKQLYQNSMEASMLSAKYLQINAKPHSHQKSTNSKSQSSRVNQNQKSESLQPVNKPDFEKMMNNYKQKITPISKVEFNEMLDKHSNLKTVI